MIFIRGLLLLDALGWHSILVTIVEVVKVLKERVDSKVASLVLNALAHFLVVFFKLAFPLSILFVLTLSGRLH